MDDVVSPHLAAAGAAWDAGPEAGAWIAARLGPLGASVGDAVPHGYAAYAVVPLDRPDDDGDDAPTDLDTLDALLDVLAPLTGDQPVHTGIWEGWGWLYDHGDDPRTARGMAALVAGRPPGRWRLGRWRLGRRARTERAAHDAALAEARERMAAERVERPAAAPLELPHRRYYLWTGPLRSATALRRQPSCPPSLVWPQDRSWFVGIPIYTREIAVGGTTATVAAVLADPRLRARPAMPATELDIRD